MQKEICEFLKEHDVEYKENYPLYEISSVKIGSKADFVSYPNTEEKIIELVKFLRKNKIFLRKKIFFLRDIFRFLRKK